MSDEGSSANSDVEVEEISESERGLLVAEESDADSDLEIEEIRTIPREVIFKWAFHGNEMFGVENTK